ncbi:MAG TPA: hypothetical protein DCW68_07480 [Rhodospirillaceae bacterium]|nr:MAG: hypothetical protein A2018_08300 [Alphaproteobacteria bacterium GWF2_58_20]HAU29928.1 hypothetical protein [Rhodospirillaceae bacterium]
MIRILEKAFEASEKLEPAELAQLYPFTAEIAALGDIELAQRIMKAGIRQEQYHQKVIQNLCSKAPDAVEPCLDAMKDAMGADGFTDFLARDFFKSIVWVEDDTHAPFLDYAVNHLIASRGNDPASIEDPYNPQSVIAIRARMIDHYAWSEDQAAICGAFILSLSLSFLRQSILAGNLDEKLVNLSCKLSSKESIGRYLGDLIEFAMDENQPEALVILLRSATGFPGKKSGSSLADTLLHENGWFWFFRCCENDKIPLMFALINHAYSTGDPTQLRQWIRDRDFNPFRSAVMNKSHDTISTLASIAKIFGGRRLVRAMLRGDDGNFPAFEIAACHDSPETFNQLVEFAENYGDKPMCRKISTRIRDSLFGIAATGTSPDMARTLMDFCEKHEGPAAVRKMLEKTSPATFEKCLLNANSNMAEFLIAECMAHDLPELAQHLESQNPSRLAEIRRLANEREISKEKAHILQDIQGYAELWMKVARMPPPVAEHSPYCFKPELYKKLLPLTSRIASLTGEEHPEMVAYKLGTVFANEQEVNRYITSCRKRYGDGTLEWIKEIGNFTVPKFGNWKPKIWADLLVRYGNSAVGKYMDFAPEIELHHRILGNFPLPTDPGGVRRAVGAIQYSRGMENLSWAEIATEYNLEEYGHHRGIHTLSRLKDRENLPQVFIDGSDIDMPNYYLAKLEISDPRGLVLGEIIDNCQSINANGAPAAEHGVTSENGGFYVWKRKSRDKITENDMIVAESWAWLSTGNHIVFDSFERLSKDFDCLAKPFLSAFAEEAKRLGFAGVMLGTGGDTPKLDFPVAQKPAKPKDNIHFTDAKKQYEVPVPGK